MIRDAIEEFLAVHGFVKRHFDHPLGDKWHNPFDFDSNKAWLRIWFYSEYAEVIGPVPFSDHVVQGTIKVFYGDPDLFAKIGRLLK